MKYNHELLTVLMEECAEVIQEASKCIRFGIDAEYKGQTAREALEKEIGDLYCMIDLLVANDLITFDRIHECSEEKYEKLKKWSNLIEE